MTDEEMSDAIRLFTITLNNALERNAELERENAKLRAAADFQTTSNMDRFFQLKRLKEQLTEAKEHIHRLLVLLTEGKRSYAVIDEARAFMQEEKEAKK